MTTAPTLNVMNNKQRRYLSVLAHALKQLAGKTANKAARDLLEDGKAYDVAIRIEATVAGEGLPMQEIVGNLNVSHDEETAENCTPNIEHVLALALARMPKTKRRQLLDGLPKEFTAAGSELPEVDDELLNEAAGLLQQLRFRKAKKRRGKVAFVPKAA